MKKCILFLILLFRIVAIYAQTSKNYQIKKNVTNYYIDDCKYSDLSYTIVNTGKSVLWMWLEKKDITAWSDSLKIYERFMKRHDGGERLYSMLYDGNVKWGACGLYVTFIKVLSPGHRFTFYTVNSSPNMNSRFFYYMEKHIVVIEETRMGNRFDGIREVSSDVFYSKNSITVPYSIFEEEK